jgi:hypothetical protein
VAVLIRAAHLTDSARGAARRAKITTHIPRHIVRRRLVSRRNIHGRRVVRGAIDQQLDVHDIRVAVGIGSVVVARDQRATEDSEDHDSNAWTHGDALLREP